MASHFLSISLLLLAIAFHNHMGTIAIDIGVCYGMNGNNLPSPSAVVAKYKEKGFNAMRLFDPNQQALEALKGSQIAVALGTLNSDIPKLASSLEGATAWFNVNVAPYLGAVEFQYLIVGNEVIPGEYANSVTAAMQNLQDVLNGRSLGGIKITTAVATSILGTSYPPSAGAFSEAAVGPMTNVLRFLSTHDSPLMANVYPYFAYASKPVNIKLDYALFTAPGPVIFDGSLSYQNLFDAIVDAVYSASEKVGVNNVGIVVSESGWPSAGNSNFTTPELAGTYNRNFASHIQSNGTPKRPQTHTEGYVFAMYNENLKTPGVEQNFGIFDASGNLKYQFPYTRILFHFYMYGIIIPRK